MIGYDNKDKIIITNKAHHSIINGNEIMASSVRLLQGPPQSVFELKIEFPC